MLNTLHIPTKIGLLAVILSTAVFAEDRFVIRVNGDVSQISSHLKVKVIKSLTGSGTGIHVISAAEGANAQATLRALASEAAVQSAEPEKPLQLPGFSSQGRITPQGNSLSHSAWLDGTPTWYYNSIAAAAYVNQQAGVVINLAKAHAFADGTGAKVAVVDTGIDRTHPVLITSVGEGYDFVHNTSGGQELVDTNQETTPILDQETTPILDQETTPILDGGSAVILRQETTPILDQETTPILDSKKYPAYGHGTMVAGLIHLVAPKAKLMPIRVFGANGAATISQVAAGIYWAVDHGADVINMSFSTSQDSPVLSAAVQYAVGKGVVLVAAAGNDGKAATVWPAAYSTVIGVASTNSSTPMIRSSFSNYGVPLVSLAAPGESDITVYPGQHYAQVTGTSFSTPLVAGGAALMVDINAKTNAALAVQDLSQANYIGQELGAGELDLYKAALFASKKN
jgi:subtilisin family serine protease